MKTKMETNDKIFGNKKKFFYLNLIALSLANTFNLVSYTRCGTMQTVIFFFLNEKSLNLKFSVIHTIIVRINRIRFEVKNMKKEISNSSFHGKFSGIEITRRWLKSHFV